MKASELIAVLSDFIAQRGDLPIVTTAYGCGVTVPIDPPEYLANQACGPSIYIGGQAE